MLHGRQLASQNDCRQPWSHASTWSNASITWKSVVKASGMKVWRCMTWYSISCVSTAGRTSPSSTCSPGQNASNASMKLRDCRCGLQTNHQLRTLTPQELMTIKADHTKGYIDFFFITVYCNHHYNHTFKKPSFFMSNIQVVRISVHQVLFCLVFYLLVFIISRWWVIVWIKKVITGS